jgi:hypothetical protein
VTAVAGHAQDAATAAGGEECEAIWAFFGIEAACVQPAIGRFRRICVHEHVREGWLCRDHAETSGRGLCGTCRELPGGLAHECLIIIAEVAR